MAYRGFGSVIKPIHIVAHWGKHNTLHIMTHLLPHCLDSVLDYFQCWKVSWHTGQRSSCAAQSSDRPAMVRGCWWINKRSRKRGFRIKSNSISERSAQPISLLPGTISTTTLQTLYNCCFLGHKQAVFITPFYSLVLSMKKKKSSSNCHIFHGRFVSCPVDCLLIKFLSVNMKHSGGSKVTAAYSKPPWLWNLPLLSFT